jgi:hypothetical protein
MKGMGNEGTKRTGKGRREVAEVVERGGGSGHGVSRRLGFYFESGRRAGARS